VTDNKEKVVKQFDMAWPWRAGTLTKWRWIGRETRDKRDDTKFWPTKVGLNPVYDIKFLALWFLSLKPEVNAN